MPDQHNNLVFQQIFEQQKEIREEQREARDQQVKNAAILAQLLSEVKALVEKVAIQNGRVYKSEEAIKRLTGDDRRLPWYLALIKQPWFAPVAAIIVVELGKSGLIEVFKTIFKH